MTTMTTSPMTTLTPAERAVLEASLAAMRAYRTEAAENCRCAGAEPSCAAPALWNEIADSLLVYTPLSPIEVDLAVRRVVGPDVMGQLVLRYFLARSVCEAVCDLLGIEPDDDDTPWEDPLLALWELVRQHRAKLLTRARRGRPSPLDRVATPVAGLGAATHGALAASLRRWLWACWVAWVECRRARAQAVRANALALGR